MGFFNAKDSKARANSRKTIIATGCKINGELVNLDGTLHVDGQIDGIIETDHDISIGIEGKVKGLIKAKMIVVSGVLEGKIACESIEVLKHGRLFGEVLSGEILIESGGKFIGESRELTEGGMVVSFSEDDKKELINQETNKTSSIEEKKKDD